MRQQPKQRIPIWKKPPKKRVSWRIVCRLLVIAALIATIVIFCLKRFSLSSVFEYCGPAVSFIAALSSAYFLWKRTKKKSAERSQALPEIVSVAFLILATTAALLKLPSDDKASQRQKAEAKQQSQQIQALNQNAQVQNHKLQEAQAQAEHYKNEEEGLARQNNNKQTLEHLVTQSLTRTSALTSQSLIKQEAARNATLQAANHIDEVSKTLSGFRSTAQGFQKTASAIDRSVNSMEKVVVSYQVLLPIGEPVMEQYRTKLTDGLSQFQSDISGDNRNKSLLSDTTYLGMRYEGSQYRSPNGKIMSNVRIEILPSSPLYPSNFDKSYENLMSYPLRIRIVKKPGSASPHIKDAVSDLLIEANQVSVPKVYYYPDLGTLTLVFANVPAAIEENTGRIWSMTDLDRARVQISRDTFDTTTYDYYGKPLSQAQKQCFLSSVVFQINNRAFTFREEAISHFTDPKTGLSASLIFNLKAGAKASENLSGPDGYS